MKKEPKETSFNWFSYISLVSCWSLLLAECGYKIWQLKTTGCFRYFRSVFLSVFACFCISHQYHFLTTMVAQRKSYNLKLASSENLVSVLIIQNTSRFLKSKGISRSKPGCMNLSTAGDYSCIRISITVQKVIEIAGGSFVKALKI